MQSTTPQNDIHIRDIETNPGEKAKILDLAADLQSLFEHPVIGQTTDPYVQKMWDRFAVIFEIGNKWEFSKEIVEACKTLDNPWAIELEVGSIFEKMQRHEYNIVMLTRWVCAANDLLALLKVEYGIWEAETEEASVKDFLRVNLTPEFDGKSLTISKLSPSAKAINQARTRVFSEEYRQKTREIAYVEALKFKVQSFLDAVKMFYPALRTALDRCIYAGGVGSE